jgi:hypothetical protein
MSIIESTHAPAATGAEREFTGAVVHALRRYARRGRDGAASPADAKVARVLDHVPAASRKAATIARQVDRMVAEQRRQLLSPGFADLSPSKPIDADVLDGILGRLGNRRPPSAAPTEQKRFEVVFSHIICDDESNPEFVGGDEPYVVFGIVTLDEAVAGLPPRVVTTPVYSKVDDGDRRPSSGSQNLRLFGPKELKSDMIVTGLMLESDDGLLADVIDVVSVVLAAAIALVDEDTLLGAILSVGDSLTDLIRALVADDPVGSGQAIALTPQQAKQLTQSAATVNLPPMRFDGGDANGRYRAFLTLKRA